MNESRFRLVFSFSKSRALRSSFVVCVCWWLRNPLLLFIAIYMKCPRCAGRLMRFHSDDQICRLNAYRLILASSPSSFSSSSQAHTHLFTLTRGDTSIPLLSLCLSFVGHSPSFSGRAHFYRTTFPPVPLLLSRRVVLSFTASNRSHQGVAFGVHPTGLIPFSVKI